MNEEYLALARDCSALAQQMKGYGLWDMARYWVDQSLYYWRIGNGY